MFLQGVGAADDPSSGGRQMPSHWSYPDLHIVTQSSPTGSQILQAVGCAEGGRYFARRPKAAPVPDSKFFDYRQFKNVTFQGDEITYVSLGDGTTSEGEFWEAMNAAALGKLPVIFCVEDNGYAISVPVEVQTAGGSISRLVAGFPNFHFEEVDGTDPVASYAAFQRAVRYCREGHGPAFVHAHVIRPYSHSLSDDERLYRPDAERERDAARDPVTPHANVPAARRHSRREGNQPARERSRSRTADRSRSRARSAAARAREHHEVCLLAGHRSRHRRRSTRSRSSPQSRQTAKRFAAKTMADLITATLRDEMKRDERIVIFGEDVADCSREEYLKRKLVKGKGGVFKLTFGLQSEFGSDRVFNSPLAEAAIVGRATGMATRGLKPVVEIQFFDYIWPAMMQIRDELSVIRWRSNNGFSCPVVIRVAIGGYLTGGAIYHSQCGESVFTHIPGLRVVFPSNALDAAGLLRTAIRCDDPVLFLEHKRLYRETFRPRALSRPGLHDPVRQGEDRASRHRPDRDHLRRSRPPRPAGRAEDSSASKA